MNSSYSYELRLERKPPHRLLFVEDEQITFRRSLPELKSIELLVEAIDSLPSDVKHFENGDWVVWGYYNDNCDFFEVSGDVCFALGALNAMAHWYEPVLDCNEDSSIRQRGDAKMEYVRWGRLDDPPDNDEEFDDDKRDRRDAVAWLLAFRGDYLMSTECYSAAIQDYRMALEIYPEPWYEEHLFGQPGSKSESRLTFLQLLKKPAVYEGQVRQHLEKIQGDELGKHLATVKAVASAFAAAEFSKYANVLERIWNDHMNVLINKQVQQTSDLLSRMLTAPVQTLGLDLDGTIDESANLFAVLTRVWPGKVFVITYRDNRDKAVAALEAFCIRFDDVILVNSFAEKAEVIGRLKIDVYIDDQDEALMYVPESVTVLKLRNGGNYNFDEKKWLYSSVTGRPV